MFFPEQQLRIWLHTGATDMRKSFDGLSAMVKTHLQENPLSGHCFVFVNRRKTQMKILYFDRSGYCLWSKRLEQGQFAVPFNSEVKRPIDWAQLKLILEGLQVQKYRQLKRYKGGAA